MKVEAGTCFLIETNNSQDGQIIFHLFIVALEPEEFTKNTIIIPVDTLHSNKQDQTTILNCGEHEFIKSRSFLNYNRSKIKSITDIERMIEKGTAKIRPPIDPKILDKIVNGIKKSDHTPSEVCRMYENNMFRKLSKK
jgi:hypothetical protein